MPLRELSLGRLLSSLASRLNAVSTKNVSDRIPTDFMTQIHQGVANPSISPPFIVRRHPNHQLCNSFWRGRPAPSPASPRIVFLGNQLPVPAQQGLWRHDAGNLPEPAELDPLGFGCQTNPLRVVESNLLFTQRLFENPDLPLKKINHRLLLALHPFRQAQKNKLQLIHRADTGPQEPSIQPKIKVSTLPQYSARQEFARHPIYSPLWRIT